MGESFNDLYKKVRNRLRAFSRRSVLAASLQGLHYKYSDRVDALRSAPWQMMLIVKWALQDSGMTDVGRPEISQLKFDGIRQFLWGFPECLVPHHIHSGSSFFRRIVYPQLQYQRGPTTGFVREAALVGRLPRAHSLRKMFEERTGLTPEQFLDFSFASYIAITVNEARAIRFRWFEAPRNEYGDAAFQSFLALVSRTYEEMIRFSRSGLDEFTPLARYPFIRDSDSIVVWHPVIFFRGMEGMVHSVLSEAGQDYIQPFSALFEAYVVSQLADIDAIKLSEPQQRELIGQKSKVVDGFMAFGGANVLVEVKAGIFRDSVMTTGDPAFFRTRTRALERAINQAWNVSTRIRQVEKSPQIIRNAAVDYLLVVTNWDMTVGTGATLREMYPEGELQYPNAESERYLPLSNVFFVSVDDWERLVEAILKDNLNLQTFLQACVERNSRRETAVFLFDQHLSASKVRDGRSKLVTQSIGESEKRLQEMVGKHSHASG
jgi:hypothetical protein